MTMSQGPWDSDGGAGSEHPLDEMWYLQGETEAQGPYKGYALKEMIEAGSVGAKSLVARVGATQWTAVADVPVFAASLPAGGRGPLHFAGFWMRLLAYVIDVIIVNILDFVPVAFVQAITGSQAAGLLFALVVWTIYCVAFTAGGWQGTPGKRICGIHVMREDGGRVSVGLALGRFLAYFISSLPLGFGFLMIGFTDQKKGLHDIICGTRVVYGRL
jgi:uncharacterized RDD family membrane protein YckC